MILKRRSTQRNTLLGGAKLISNNEQWKAILITAVHYDLDTNFTPLQPLGNKFASPHRLKTSLIAI